MSEGTVLWLLADEIHIDRQVALSTVELEGIETSLDEYYQPVVASEDVERVREILRVRQALLRENRRVSAETRADRTQEEQDEIDRARVAFLKDRPRVNHVNDDENQLLADTEEQYLTTSDSDFVNYALPKVVYEKQGVRIVRDPDGKVGIEVETDE